MQPLKPLKFGVYEEISSWNIQNTLQKGKFRGLGYGKFAEAFSHCKNPKKDLKVNRESGKVTLHREGKKDLVIQLYQFPAVKSDLPKISTTKKFGEFIKKSLNKHHDVRWSDKMRSLATNISDIGNTTVFKPGTSRQVRQEQSSSSSSMEISDETES